MKPSAVAYIQNEYPLVDLRMTRQDCLTWMADRGHPEPPRSACVFCPFHGDDEWLRLRDENPGSFLSAVMFERKFQEACENDEVMNGVPVSPRLLCPTGSGRLRLPTEPCPVVHVWERVRGSMWSLNASANGNREDVIK